MFYLHIPILPLPVRSFEMFPPCWVSPDIKSLKRMRKLATKVITSV